MSKITILDQYPSSIISRAMGVKLYEELEKSIDEPCHCKQCGMAIERGIPQDKCILRTFSAIEFLASPASKFVCKWCDSIRRVPELYKVQGYLRKPDKTDGEYTQEEEAIAKDYTEKNKKMFGCIFYGGDNPHMKHVYAENVMETLKNPSPDGLPFVFLLRVHHTVAQSTNKHCAWMAPVNFSNTNYRIYLPWKTVQVDIDMIEEILEILSEMDKEKWMLYSMSYQSSVHQIAKGDKDEQAQYFNKLGNYTSEMVALAGRIIECNEKIEKGDKS